MNLQNLQQAKLYALQTNDTELYTKAQQDITKIITKIK